MTNSENQKSAPLPPGETGLPFIGETLSFLFDPDFAKKKKSKYGQIYKTNIFGNDTVTMIGAEANQFLFRNENKYFETWSQGLFSLPINLPWTNFGKALKCRQKMLQAIETIIIDRRRKPRHQNDALGILLEAKDEEGNSLTIEELKDQILLLLFAGHETLTSSLSSFSLLMAQHPDILQKVKREQDNLNITDIITPEKLKEMTYLEQVLKESLRLIPPVAGAFRKVIQEFEFGGYRIPKDWTVQYQIAQTHQETDTFPDYNTFEPERFSPDNMADKQKNFCYVPFGGGLRECLGKEFARLEMKIFASVLVRNCHWQLLPNQDLEMITIPSPRPRDGLKVKITKV